MNIDGLIFDLDGTLWDAVARITEIWKNSVCRETDVDLAVFTEDNIRSLMGLNTEEIGNALFPASSPDRRGVLMELCSEAERKELPKKGGALYPRVRETLSLLKEKYPLFIVSNCDKGYIEAFLSYHRLEACFTDFLCYGDTGKDKWENIRETVKKHGLKRPLYVGDTEKDRLSAEKAGVRFVHAAYGFGTLSVVTDSIKAFDCLPRYLES